MLLTEIFNTANINIEWQGTNGMFELGDYQYIIQFIHMKPNDMIHHAINDQPITKNTYFFAFAAIDKNNGQSVDTDINAGQSITIFSVIMQALQKQITKNNIDTLYFGCSAGHNKRKRIYQKIIDRYTKISDWHTVGETEASFFGELKHIWVVQK